MFRFPHEIAALDVRFFQIHTQEVGSTRLVILMPNGILASLSDTVTRNFDASRCGDRWLEGMNLHSQAKMPQTLSLIQRAPSI